MIRTVLTVFGKELRDAVRDRRTWIVALTISLASGPAVLVLISTFVAGIQEKVAQREVFVAGAERAPTLVNYLLRAGANVKPAPPDYEAQLRSGRLGNAVIVVPEDFEPMLARGEAPKVKAVYDGSHDKATAVVRTTLKLVEGFNREAGTQRLLARGVSPQLLAPIEVEEIDLAPAQSRGAQLLFIVPWAALIVAIVGALSVAIDVSAGERERGSLEPLLMNPVPALALVIGKWGVVMTYSIAIVVLTMAGFLVSMRLITNETLAALMQLDWRETGIFCALLLPFAALMAALNMLAATFGRSHKEAQTYVSYIAMAAQFAAIAPVFLTVRDAAWQLLVPSVAQLTVLMKALRGEAIASHEMLIPAAVCLVGTAICLGLQARLLRREAVIFARS